MPATLPPPAGAWNSWNLGSGSAAAAGPLFSWPVAPGPGPPLRSPPSPASPARSNPPLPLFIFGGGVGVRRPGKAPALCVVWDRGSGPLPFRCRRYAANSMGCSLITYLITEECQQCVCFGKGAGGMRRDHRPLCSAHQKAEGEEGESWDAPASVPPFPGERAFPLAFWRRGLGVLVILTRSCKINLFPVVLWQLHPHPSSSSHWGEGARGRAPAEGRGCPRWG